VRGIAFVSKLRLHGGLREKRVSSTCETAFVVPIHVVGSGSVRVLATDIKAARTLSAAAYPIV